MITKGIRLLLKNCQILSPSTSTSSLGRAVLCRSEDVPTYDATPTLVHALAVAQDHLWACMGNGTVSIINLATGRTVKKVGITKAAAQHHATRRPS
jgi:hypothetical protein